MKQKTFRKLYTFVFSLSTILHVCLVFYTLWMTIHTTFLISSIGLAAVSVGKIVGISGASLSCLLSRVGFEEVYKKLGLPKSISSGEG